MQNDVPATEAGWGWGEGGRVTVDFGDRKCSLVKGCIWDHQMSGTQLSMLCNSLSHGGQ